MATIFPLSASVGQEFQGYMYDGTIWNLIGNEFNPTTFSSNPPDNPKPGDLWVDSYSNVDILNDTNLASISDLNNYLTVQSASTGYLTKESASSTYLDKVSASTIYQAKVANVDDTEIGYLNNASANIQTQLNSKQATISGVSDTEIGYLDGVTSAIQTQLNAKQTLEDSGWINVSSLSNSFTAPTTVAYRKLNGVVYLRGNLFNGTANTTAFTLPSGYRPSVEVVVPVQKFGTADIAYVTVATSGAVTPNSTAGWLSGVCFPVG